MPRKKVSIIEQRTVGIKMGKYAAIKWIQEQIIITEDELSDDHATG